MIDATSGILAVPVTAADPARPAQRQPAPPAEQDQAAARKAEAVENAMRELSPPVMGQNERLSIQRDHSTGTFIYRSIDRETGEVVRQWPVESMLQFKAYLRQVEGVLVDDKI